MNGLRSLSSRYDLLLCDVWGVLHNGVSLFTPAIDALERFRQGGGHVILLSNAPRPAKSVKPQLQAMGISPAAFDELLTSGDLTRAVVTERSNQVVHHLGPPRDLPIFEGLDVTFGSIAEADFVVCSGFHNDERETAADYHARLTEMRTRELPMVCANPDLIVERGEKIIPCAGSIALAYEEMGGQVYYGGKPHRPIYAAAMELAQTLNRGRPIPVSNVLAIGDAIRTDIAGAVRFGIDAVLIARGIHAQDLGVSSQNDFPTVAQGWISQQEVQPSGIMRELFW